CSSGSPTESRPASAKSPKTRTSIPTPPPSTKSAGNVPKRESGMLPPTVRLATWKGYVRSAEECSQSLGHPQVPIDKRPQSVIHGHEGASRRRRRSDGRKEKRASHTKDAGTGQDRSGILRHGGSDRAGRILLSLRNRLRGSLGERRAGRPHPAADRWHAG